MNGRVDARKTIEEFGIESIFFFVFPGDGAFGKVHKARHRVTGTLAAAKICKLEVL